MSILHYLFIKPLFSFLYVKYDFIVNLSLKTMSVFRIQHDNKYRHGIHQNCFLRLSLRYSSGIKRNHLYDKSFREYYCFLKSYDYIILLMLYFIIFSYKVMIIETKDVFMLLFSYKQLVQQYIQYPFLTILQLVQIIYFKY